MTNYGFLHSKDLSTLLKEIESAPFTITPRLVNICYSPDDEYPAESGWYGVLEFEEEILAASKGGA